MRWFDSITDSVNMNLSKLQEMVEDIGGWCAILHGVAKSWTQLSKGTTNLWVFINSSISIQIRLHILYYM